MSCYYVSSRVIYVSPIYSRIHVDRSFSSQNYIFFILEITIWNKMRILYSRIDFFFFFWNINSTIISWLIYTFSSQLNTFCMLHVIPCFHKGKVQIPNYPLQYFCMLGLLGYEMCLFRKLYVEGFIDIFGEFFLFLIFFLYLFDLESKMVVVFPSHLIHITVQLLIHILHFLSPSMLAWRRIAFPLAIWSCTKYLWSRCIWSFYDCVVVWCF